MCKCFYFNTIKNYSPPAGASGNFSRVLWKKDAVNVNNRPIIICYSGKEVSIIWYRQELHENRGRYIAFSFYFKQYISFIYWFFLALRINVRLHQNCFTGKRSCMIISFFFFFFKICFHLAKMCFSL